MRNLAIAACLMAAPHSLLCAQATVWTGAVSSDWFDPGNWTVGVPNPQTSAEIGRAQHQPAPDSFYPGPYAECLDLAVHTGASIDGSGVVQVLGDIRCQGDGGNVELMAGAHEIGCADGGRFRSIRFHGNSTASCQNLVATVIGDAPFAYGSYSVTLHGLTQLGTIDAPAGATGRYQCGHPDDTWIVGYCDIGTSLDVPNNLAIGVRLRTSSGFGQTGGVIRVLPGYSVSIDDGRFSGAMGNSSIEVPSDSSFTYTRSSSTTSYYTASVPSLRCEGTATISTDQQIAFGALDVAGTLTLRAVTQPARHSARSLALTGHVSLRQGAGLDLDPGSAPAPSPFLVAAGASLRLVPDGPQVSTLRVRGELDVQGLLEVGAGCAVEHVRSALATPCRTSIGPSGTLRLLGTPTQPVVVSGTTQGDYLFEIRGLVEARDYEFRNMGPLGVRLLGSSQIGAAPYDLRYGVFADGSAQTGATLLDVGRQQATALRDVEFEDDASGASHGVRSSTTLPVTITDYSGRRAGPEFEDDPSGAIQWLQEPCWHTALGAAIGGGDNVVLPVQPIGFPFVFRGVTYSQVYVSTNGFAYLADGLNTPIPTDSRPVSSASALVASANPILAPLWHDLDSAGLGACHIFHSTDRCVVTWRDFVESGDSVRFDLQLTLFPDGEFTFSHGGNAAVRTTGTALVGISPGGGVPMPPYGIDLAQPGVTASGTVFALFDSSWPIPLAGGSLRFAPLGTEFRFRMTTCHALSEAFGAGCGGASGAFYEHFATPAAFDLSNSAFVMVPTAGGYVVQPSTATLVGPPPGAYYLTLADDEEVTLSLWSASPPYGFPYPGGSADSLTIGSNGYVATGATGLAADKTPSPQELLASPYATWAVWRDFGPAYLDPGYPIYVQWFRIGSTRYVTWDGVASNGYHDPSGWPPPPPSTFQLQFNQSNGNVTFVFQNMQTTGGAPGDRGYVVGFSPGRSRDAGGRDLSVAIPQTFSLTVPEGNLTLDALAPPAFGSSVSLWTSNIPANSPLGAVFLGITGYPFGIDLASVGMPDCLLYLAPLDSRLFVAPMDTIDYLVPSDVGLLNRTIHAQSAVIAPGRNPLEMITSNGVRMTIGW